MTNKVILALDIVKLGKDNVDKSLYLVASEILKSALTNQPVSK
jgi:hypothetical protein